jgi:hypothetical protein
MDGVPLKETIDRDSSVREACLFGVHGGQVNVTDGKYLYMRGPSGMENSPLFDYTLMPTHMSRMFGVHELQEIELREPFPFTRGCRTMKIKARSMINPYIYGSLLFDLDKDPGQEHPLKDGEIEKRMIRLMVDLMKKNDAPVDQFERLGLPFDGQADETHLSLKPISTDALDKIGNTDVVFKHKGKTMYYSLLSYIPDIQRRTFELGVEEIVNTRGIKELDEDQVIEIVQLLIPQKQVGSILWIAEIVRAKGRTDTGEGDEK